MNSEKILFSVTKVTSPLSDSVPLNKEDSRADASVTFIASGDFLSDDSFGNKGLLQAGAFVIASNNKVTN